MKMEMHLWLAVCGVLAEVKTNVSPLYMYMYMYVPFIDNVKLHV